MSLPQGLTVAPGDVVLFIGKDRKPVLRVAKPGEHLQTHYGVVQFDDIFGLAYGEQARTHIGNGIYVLPPNVDDVITHLRRETQIIYPKDSGYIITKLAIRPGVDVIEAGTGSGALTILLAMLVGETGRVYSYDRKTKAQGVARRNLTRMGLDHRVELIEKDISEGFEQTGIHALFLDVQTPWDYLEHARAALRGGGFFGAIVPTVNQLTTLLEHLYHGAWYLLQAEELILRPWKTIYERTRPDDQMNGHTGFLVFARAVNREVRSQPDKLEDE